MSHIFSTWWRPSPFHGRYIKGWERGTFRSSLQMLTFLIRCRAVKGHLELIRAALNDGRVVWWQGFAHLYWVSPPLRWFLYDGWWLWHFNSGLFKPALCTFMGIVCPLSCMIKWQPPAYSFALSLSRTVLLLKCCVPHIWHLPFFTSGMQMGQKWMVLYVSWKRCVLYTSPLPRWQMWIFQYVIFHVFKYNEKHKEAGKMETSAK